MEEALVREAGFGDTSTVALLLSLGVRVDTRDQGFTPLLAATQHGHTEVCKLLLQAGSDLNEREPQTLSTALHFAALTGHQSIIQLLLSHKADVNSRDRRGFTPLHNASQEDHLTSVMTLLEAGADPLLPKYDGALPIGMAAQQNHSRVVKILIEQGRCSPDQVRQTALQSLDHLSYSFRVKQSFIIIPTYHDHDHDQHHNDQNRCRYESITLSLSM